MLVEEGLYGHRWGALSCAAVTCGGAQGYSVTDRRPEERGIVVGNARVQWALHFA